MADANSVSPGLATLGAGGWTVTEPSAGGRFGSVGVLTPQQTLATQALVSGAWRRSRLARPNQIVQPGMLTAGASTNRTYTSAFSAWGPFHAARVLLQNPTGAAYTIDNLSMAPTANAVMLGDNMVQPSGGSGAWTTPTGAISLTNTGSVANPGLNWTAMQAVRSLARADGSPFHALLVRTYHNLTAPCYHGGASFNALLDGTFAASSGGHIFGTGNKAGDMVTAPGSWTTGGVDASGPAQVVTAVDFEYDYRMRVIMPLGDSIMAGENSVNRPQCGAGFLATLSLSLSGYKVAHMAGGVGGQTAAQIDTRGRAMMAAVLPDIVVLPSWTPNTAYATQADWDAQWQVFCGLADYAMSLNLVPVFITPWPKSGLNGTQATARATQRARVIASGLPYADIEAAVTASDGTGNWISGFSGEGTHPNQSTNALMAPILAAAMSQLVG